MNTNLLSIKNLVVQVEEKTILNGINISMKKGEMHAIMGPNGSGKSSLALTIIGHPKYKSLSGNISFLNKNLESLPVNKRAQLGIFLAFQHPHEIEGISLRDFLQQSYNAIYGKTDKQLSPKEFRVYLDEKMKLLKIKDEFVERSINFGFSGGEKKRTEILQLAILQPKLAILDEIDSGLDIDALKTVCNGINKIKKDNQNMTILIITHYPRILNYLPPNFVHVMQNGKIIKSGNKELANQLELTGYSN